MGSAFFAIVGSSVELLGRELILFGLFCRSPVNREKEKA